MEAFYNDTKIKYFFSKRPIFLRLKTSPHKNCFFQSRSLERFQKNSEKYFLSLSLSCSVFLILIFFVLLSLVYFQCLTYFLINFVFLFFGSLAVWQKAYSVHFFFSISLFLLCSCFIYLGNKRVSELWQGRGSDVWKLFLKL